MKCLMLVLWTLAALNSGALFYAWEECTTAQRQGGIFLSFLLAVVPLVYFMVIND